MFRLLPREDKYFDMFNRMAAHMMECALLLQKLFSDFDNRVAYADKIKEVEHNCDLLTHEIVKKLNQTFITPFDREDIHALASGLDTAHTAGFLQRSNVVFVVEDAAAGQYRVEPRFLLHGDVVLVADPGAGVVRYESLAADQNLFTDASTLPDSVLDYVHEAYEQGGSP